MPDVVVPYRGRDGKSRLSPSTDGVRGRIALAMLWDVLAACTAVGATSLVTDDVEAEVLADDIGARVVPDPGRGQGAAVAAGLAVCDRPALVVNADLPAATARDLLSLLGATPEGGIALVPALDGRTNALCLSAPHQFAPLYGPGSADRFLQHARRLGVEAAAAEIPNLVLDVDTAEDLAVLGSRIGSRTREALALLAAFPA